jgi:hypothetical protein
MTDEEIRIEIIKLVEQKALGIPDSVRGNYDSLIRAGEYAIALDFVEDWIVDNDIMIERSLYQRILTIRSEWGQKGRAQEYIFNNLILAGS